MASRYGITLEEARQLRTEILACEICDRKRRLEADHCHKSGKFRGRICVRCNRGIGCFDDDPELMLKAIGYLTSRTPGLIKTAQIPTQKGDQCTPPQRSPKKRR
jgi:hypothetical protein